MSTDDGVTLRTATPGRRSAQLVEGEARAMRHLVERRSVWLAEPRNRLLPTYEAVRRSTLEMAWALQELECELREAQAAGQGAARAGRQAGNSI